MNNIGLMAGNAFSTLITDRIGMQGLFWLSGIVAFISVAIIFRMKETLPNPKPLKLNHFKLGLEDHWDKRAKDPAIVMLLSVTLFGTIITLIPDYSIGLGIENKGLFLSIATISTVFTRLTTSRLSDIKGRIFSCKIGTSFWFLASILLVFPSLTTFYIAAVLCGMASGINSPALFAWAVDVANGERSGRALATLFITLEAGITVGAFVSAYIYDNTFSNFRYVFLFLASIMVIALLFLVLGVNSKETKKSS
jgi:MFS family permease